MPEVFSGMPIAVVFVVFFLGAFVRGHLIYSLTKYGTELAVDRARPRGPVMAKTLAWLDSSAADSGIRIIRRFGLVAVPAAYLTVGIQTVIMGAAGVVGIPRWQFALAQIPGCLAWAAIYTTVGWAAWEAVFIRAAGNWWAVAALVAAAGAMGWWLRRRMTGHTG
ncbi:hypothetical protein ACFSSC_08660 [Corynebacterium mendelii]|uniref:DedA family protein n=1 Tax=Corynebacterium mendelii TaxID=2765362 RepID=A0A939E431_9CORY|nr:hypothetical protein [Corynebacterium mendelii]MBN9645047.1 hypothetical protein [Corynebacterium mendelii]